MNLVLNNTERQIRFLRNWVITPLTSFNIFEAVNLVLVKFSLNNPLNFLSISVTYWFEKKTQHFFY